MCYDHVLPKPRSPIAVAGQLVRDIPDRHHSLACEAAKLLRDLHDENVRLREKLQRHEDYQDMKQRWAEESLRASPTRIKPRPPIVESPHGE